MCLKSFPSSGDARGGRLWFAISKRPTFRYQTGRLHTNPAPFFVENALTTHPWGHLFYASALPLI